MTFKCSCGAEGLEYVKEGLYECWKCRKAYTITFKPVNTPEVRSHALDVFQSLLSRYDPTEEYSDDPEIFRHGFTSRRMIEQAAGNLPRHQAVALYNEHMDKLFGENAAQYYWE